MRKIINFVLVFCTILILSSLVSALPNGAVVTNLTSSRANVTSAGNDSAIAGNITELAISGYSITQSWQGYFGNVTGTIMLADNSDNVMYNWSLASPEGEIYASTNDSISWADVQCFNFDADGTYIGAETPGDTNQHGTNLTILEAMFGIADDDVDGVNETFTLLGSGHNTFYTNNLNFSEGECRNTQVFTNSGQGEDNKFEEVLLYEPTTRSIIFTSLLNENVFGFDNNPHDFEMLVLENGHLTDTETTTYYFWIELE